MFLCLRHVEQSSQDTTTKSGRVLAAEKRREREEPRLPFKEAESRAGSRGQAEARRTAAIVVQFLTMRLLLGLVPHVRRMTARRSLASSVSSVLEWEKAAGRTLVIVESPAKAKTIQGFLDKDEYVVDFCAGHIRDLPSKSKEVAPEYRRQMVLDALKLNVADLGVNVNNGFEPLYVPMAGKAEVLKRLTHLSKDCSRILLATDEDREGEAISWHLLEVLKPQVPFKRAVFHEITKNAILQSFSAPRDIDMDLVHSQETRRILDRLAGYTISPVLWRYIATGLSAGRVQSCGLYLLTQVRSVLTFFRPAFPHASFNESSDCWPWERRRGGEGERGRGGGPVKEMTSGGLIL